MKKNYANNTRLAYMLVSKLALANWALVSDANTIDVPN